MSPIRPILCQLCWLPFFLGSIQGADFGLEMRFSTFQESLPQISLRSAVCVWDPAHGRFASRSVLRAREHTLFSLRHLNYRDGSVGSSLPVLK